MLWYKAWLETRWRFAFLIGSILLVWLMPLWLPSLSAVPASRQMVWPSTGVGPSLHVCGYLFGRCRHQQPNYVRCHIGIPWLHALHAVSSRFAPAVALCASGFGCHFDVHPGHRHGGVRSVPPAGTHERLASSLLHCTRRCLHHGRLFSVCAPRLRAG